MQNVTEPGIKSKTFPLLEGHILLPELSWYDYLTDASPITVVFPWLENVLLIFQVCYMQNGMKCQHL